jgi:hypothetical protein
MKGRKMKQEIYVISRKDDDYRWLEASEEIDRFKEGVLVGVYKLVGVKKKCIEHSLK